MIKRHNNLPANIVSFCQYLRKHDFTVGTNEQYDALQALSQNLAFSSPTLFKQCLQSTMCKSEKELSLFSTLFNTFWTELKRAVDSKITEEPEQKMVPKKQSAPTIAALRNWLHGSRNQESFETALYSPDGIKSAAQPLLTDEDELYTIFAIVNRIVKRIASKRTRRFVSSRHKDKIDIRSTIRKNIYANQDLLSLVHKTKKKNLKVVILCDVSRSMELYSRFFIQFMYAFKQLMQNSEVFVFGTELHQVTEELDHKSLDKSLALMLKKVNDWSGGTQIGKSLHSFVDEYAQKYLSKRTVCFILSDGWDTGSPELITQAMEMIQKRSMKVIWLNPLMENNEWKPEVQGMMNAMPFIDLLLPFYNLDSMKRLAKSL